MQPIQFPESNFVFTKPANMTDDECSDLHVWKGEVPIGEGGRPFRTIISKWKMSPEELQEAIKSGGEVYLSITGEGMPPVSVFVGNPFTEQ